MGKKSKKRTKGKIWKEEKDELRRGRYGKKRR